MFLIPFLVSNGLLFGTAPSYRVPQDTGTVVHLDGERYNAFLTPTNPHAVIFCCDDTNDIFYLLFRNHIVCDCIWPKPVSTEKKSKIFYEARNWYGKFSNVSLDASFSKEDDLYAWSNSFEEF